MMTHKKLNKKKCVNIHDLFPGLNIDKAKFALLYRRLQDDGTLRCGGCNIEEHCLSCKTKFQDTVRKYCDNEEILWCTFWSK